jgi:hypothetical protein
MKGENKPLLFMVSAGMELCYAYACTSFVTTALFHRTFPFPEAVASFIAAALLTLFTDGRGWRVIFVLAVQSLGFVPAFLRMLDIFNSWSESFASLPLFKESSMSPIDSAGYFIVLLIIAWIWVFWAGGVQLARRPQDYATVCSRFDRGLVAFFVLFLAKFYLQAVQSIQVDDPASGFLIFPFLIFGLLAIGLVRNQSAAQRDFLPGYQRIGVVLGFIVVVLLVGIGLIFFWLPYLTLAAEGGYGILTFLSTPIVSVLFRILNWLFGTDLAISDQPPEQAQVQHPTSQWIAPWWLELLGQILAALVVIILALFVLALLGMILYFIFQGLIGKTTLDPEKSSPQRLLASLAAQLRAFLLLVWRALVRNVQGYGGAVLLYTALRTWGRRSGLSHSLDETPTEYGRRLEHRFPVLAREIQVIVQAFNREVYGEIVLDEQQLATARSAWRQLASPLHWPMRLRAWFIRPARISETVQYETLDRNLAPR